MSNWKRFAFLVAFIVPALAVVGYYLGGGFNFLTFTVVFGILPILDVLVGSDPSNPDEAEVVGLQQEFYFRFLTYVWAWLQFALVLWSLWEVQTHNLTWLEWTGFVLAIGINTGGIGITVAHELGHKNTKVEQWYSKFILMTVCYMHFFIEHNRGHHINVSTDGDPASSRKGESFYSFYPRTVMGSFTDAWFLEKKRLEKKGRSVWTFENEMITSMIVPALFIGAVLGVFYALTGILKWEVLAFFLVQSWIAFSLLELVNYIEHYGLKRLEVSPGKFEKVLPIHSWNQNFAVSNAFLFQLQRHSDHHANAGRRYQSLRHFDESPQLPYGYEVMILIALFPSLWYKIMDWRLENWKQKYYGSSDGDKRRKDSDAMQKGKVAVV
ncbi:putative alkane 1-monooxygenase [Leptospira fainei serovar Hurstbridge str. BUT 6]|uniref:Alkane 1-monooxygenase n=1 Tax=Leptospira fainei serovar Hurstbridge str. BUT 6 TaxID=1193011 RepID=S3UXM8_9LEPT|nr:alkane 1-monooxygenase [Leptospira fainei]EPG73993.1 putative alkane 1-monooxygenase [Leptospira fainei serovar Hurstbridge str. BUT 6]